MFDCSVIQSIADTTNNPATEEEIRRAEAALGHTFPEEYRAFLQCSNGITAHGTIYSIVLYSTDELQERNETYEVQIYAPTLLMIGDNGGGQGVLIEHGRTGGLVYRIGHGSMVIDDAIILADNLSEWFHKGLPLAD
jgi:hypothetical protein